MKYKFKLGDRVKWMDQLATVIAIDTADDIIPYGIWLDNRTPFTHQLSDVCGGFVKFWSKGPDAKQRLKESKGYWVSERLLKPADDMRIVIETDGKRVTASYYNNDNLMTKGIARCHPDDEFNFFTGAKIALIRAEEMQVLSNGRYVYVGENTIQWTRGAIYEFINGITLDNKEDKYPSAAPITLAEANDSTSFFSQNFVKLV